MPNPTLIRNGYARLFREVVLRTYREQHQAKGSEQRRLEGRRGDLLQQKRNLGRELARGTLDSNSYQELREEIDAELVEIRVAPADATVQEIDVEGVLDFAEELFLDPAKMWRQLPPAKKRLFQSSVFPAGATFDGTELRTPLIASFLSGLQDLEGAETRMASLMIPSSNFSGWITRLGVLKGRLAEAA